MTRRTAKYLVTLNTPATGVIECGSLIVRELNGNTDGIGFKYSPEYLAHPAAFSIDPVALPLSNQGLSHKTSSNEAFQFPVNNNLPGFLDDYLPDRWGRKVLTRAATVSNKSNFNANSVIDILSLVSKSNIGAISIDAENESASYDLGLAYRELFDAENAAQIIDDVYYQQEQSTKIPLEATKLIHLWQEGSGGVGGARPKSLIHKDSIGYLAKYNSRKDDYNNAKVELACLLMAKEAGLNVKGGFVEQDVNGRDVLFLSRFDLLNDNKNRRHLVTINSMLKDKVSFVDYGAMFKYDNIHQLLKIHSVNIEQDLKQLLRMMLFNRAINNVDDHERNFSLVNDGNGYQLSPAYDLVPSLTVGQYHAAGFQYSSFPLRPTQIDGSERVLGVPKKDAKRCAEQVIHAVEKWSEYADQVGVCEKDMQRISAAMNI